MFSRLLEETAGLPLCDGTNASDSKRYRPGLIALRELGIRSPLAEAGLEKEEIHALAGLSGLDNPNQHARPCLLTRLPYGFSPTPDLLAALAEAEQRIERALIDCLPAVPDFRLRLPAPDRLELHISEPLTAEQEQSVKNTTASLFLPALNVVGIDKLSGFFDRISD
jgi:uncharacterized protein